MCRGKSRKLFVLDEQFRKFNFKHQGDFKYDKYGGIADTAFDLGDISAIQFGLKGQLFLGHAMGKAQCFYIVCQHLANLSHALFHFCNNAAMEIDSPRNIFYKDG